MKFSYESKKGHKYSVEEKNLSPSPDSFRQDWQYEIYPEKGEKFVITFHFGWIYLEEFPSRREMSHRRNLLYQELDREENKSKTFFF